MNIEVPKIVCSTLGELEKNLARLEQSFNQAGHFPIVSTFSGLVRALAGVFQTALSIVFGILSAISDCPALSQRHWGMATHGLVNISRGAVEMVPVVGNLLCYRYDQDSRFRYLGESWSPKALWNRFLSYSEELSLFASQNRELFPI